MPAPSSMGALLRTLMARSPARPAPSHGVEQHRFRLVVRGVPRRDGRRALAYRDACQRPVAGVARRGL